MNAGLLWPRYATPGDLAAMHARLDTLAANRKSIIG